MSREIAYLIILSYSDIAFCSSACSSHLPIFFPVELPAFFLLIWWYSLYIWKISPWTDILLIYLLPLCSLPSHSLNDVHWLKRNFEFWYNPIYKFPPWFFVLPISFNKIFPYPKIVKILPCFFFPEKIYCFILTFMCTIYWKCFLLMVWGRGYNILFFFFCIHS